jgi:hypothetical protein
MTEYFVILTVLYNGEFRTVHGTAWVGADITTRQQILEQFLQEMPTDWRHGMFVFFQAEPNNLVAQQAAGVTS